MKTNYLVKLIGNTPVIELSGYSSKGIRIMAKIEGNNPGGSIKDRVAWYLIRDALENHKIKPSTVLIESTSGNTGIGMAMISALMGIKFVAVMKRNVSQERKKLIMSYGATVIVVDDPLGYVKGVVEDKTNYVWLNQYQNNANVLAHYETTGREIIDQVPEVIHFVAGMGTGGTLMGVGRKLRKWSGNVEILGVEPPENSAIQGLRNYSRYTPEIFRREELNGVMRIEDEAAFDLARDLTKRHGLSVGMSSGAALWGVIETSRRIKRGTIVTVFPDRADRYLSTKLFID